MGADIWLGHPSSQMGYFRDSYGSGLTTLNYLGLSYWTDLVPLLDDNGVFPLERNAWLLDELRLRVAKRLTAPAAVATAAEYLIQNNLRGVPAMLVEVWYEHIHQLIELLERSQQSGVPLYMSL